MEKINLVELLKDCPKGMELDCTLYDNIVLDSSSNWIYPIKVTTKDGGTSLNLTKYGCISENKNAKCVIFPKGKTTWEGFIPPCKFKDGDICYVKTTEFEYIFIFKVSEDYNYIQKYANLSEYGLYIDESPVCITDGVKEIRLATEKEKQKLFDAIKAKGYRWNIEAKTLEVLPNFKIGDNVKKKGDTRLITIKDIKDNYYIITIPDYFDNCYVTDKLLFSNQNNYELVPSKFDISTLNPFDKVLVRDTNGQVWTADFFSHIIDTNPNLRTTFVCVGHYPNQCIPYEGNEHLRGTTNDCDEYFKTWE